MQRQGRIAVVAVLASLAGLAACSGGAGDQPTVVTYSIRGAVSGASGVTVSLSGAASASTTTDGSGNYSFTGLSDGNYVVTPSKAAYTFTPASRSVAVAGADVAGQDFTASPVTYAISGNVSGASSVTMHLTGAATATVTTDGGGNYSFTGLSNGSYVVTPSKTGYTFSPVSSAVTVSGADVTGKNFAGTAAAATYTISGAVSGAVTSGVTITLGGAATGTTTTGNGGTYSFANVANGSYTVTPSAAGYTFSPASLSPTVSGADVSGQNFVASVVTYTISGHISGASAVTVTLTGTANRSTTTDGSGNYSFAGLSNGSYTVTPSKIGYAFNPVSAAVTVAGADVSGKDFSGTVLTYTISGNVTGASSVTVDLTGAANTTTTTDGSGNYSFTGLSNGTYTVTPSKNGYVFTPANLSVTVNYADATGKNFTASVAPTYTLSGTVTGPWVEDVKITLSGAASRTTQSNSSGQYTFSGLSNGTYTVTPSLDGYTYTPAAPSVTISGGNQFRDFTATPAVGSYSISGAVSYGGSKTGRIYVLAYDVNCTNCSPYGGTSIAAPGSYTIRGLRTGSYTLVARMDVNGHGAQNASDPSGSGSATITAANVTGANISLSDPATPTPAAPAGLFAFPANGTVLVIWDEPWSGNGETARSYDLSWGTDTNASNGGTVTVDARDDCHYIHRGLSDGTVLYYKVRGRVETSTSAWSAVSLPVTVGVVGGGYTVSGTVSFTGTATGPLYVGLMDETNKETAPVLRMTRYPAPSSSPVAFSVSGVTSGPRYLFAIIDQNDDGVIDEGDISNTGGQGTVIDVSGNMTGQAIVLDSANAHARTTTEHDLDAYSNHNYNLDNRVDNGVKRAVAVTLFAGKNVPVPADLGKQWEFDGWTWLGNTRPTAGDTYRYKVTYSDGTSEILTSSITGVLDSFAQSLSANSGAPYSPGVPMFTWAPPASPPATYWYLVSLWGNGANWWYPDSNTGLPSTTLQARYNEDGNAYPAVLGTGTYTWGVSVEDANGNRARSERTYTVP